MSDGSSDVCSSDLDHAHRIEERQDPQIGKADATVRAMGQGHFECGQYARGLALEIMVPLTIFDGKGAADFPCFGVVDRAYVSGKDMRSEEHTSELQSLMRISYAVLCLKKNNKSIT